MELLLDIDPNLDIPRHRQVYDAVRSAILGGRLRPGDRLPPTRVLAEQLSLSRATVTEAYDQLQAEGYLLGRHGSGTFVAPNIPEDSLPASDASQTVGDEPLTSPALSPWGARISTESFRGLLRPSERPPFEFDFRPQQVARDAFPWRAWREAVERALAKESHLLSYPPSAGHAELRQAICRHVIRYRAVDCGPDQIVVVNGSQQGITLLSHLLLDTGSRVAVEDPGYPAARLTFESYGFEIERVPVDDQGMMVAELAQRPACRLIHVTPSHQDPTGATLSLARRLALLEIGEQTRSFILEDDYDSEFRYEGRPVESLQGLDRSGLVVYAGTFSKSVLPGLRIGYLILPETLVRPLVTAKSLWDGGSPMLEQTALAEFLNSGAYERHIRRMRRLYRSRRDTLIATLARHFGPAAGIGERHGGLNLLLTLDLDLTEEEIMRRAMARGVFLQSASSYYCQPPPTPTFLLGFGGLDEADLEAGVSRLAVALAAPS